MKHLLMMVLLCAGTANAQQILPHPPASADVVILGEVHDNPRHHEVQATLVAQIAPDALVLEMLTPEQAAAVTPENRQTQAELDAALGWSESGWPDFAMYYPIFAAAPDAVVIGAAVPRDRARAAMETGIAESFGAGAELYGLAAPLAGDQQEAREALQMAAHCDAMPEDMLPVMVDLQRLRDAVLARAAVDAVMQTGGKVAVITGNGHARLDWGAPSLIALARPDLHVWSLGQAEADNISGNFDAVLSAEPVDRGDPCAEFK